MQTKRTILSLAILKTNWDAHQRDYIESFIPFLLMLIEKNKYTNIDAHQIVEDFSKEFGLEIPYHPITSILKRLTTRGFIKRNNIDGKFIPTEKISGYDFTNKSADINKEIDAILLEIGDFTLKRFELFFEKSEIEDGLVEFLKEHDLDILFATETTSILPTVNKSKKLKYIIGSFITENALKNEAILKTIVNISVGHALASTLMYSELSNLTGKLKNLEIYFDTRFLIRLLGFEGDARRNVCEGFIELLRNEQAKLHAFSINFIELEKILSDCMLKLQKGVPNFTTASRVLRFFLQNKVTSSDVEQKLVNLKDNLGFYGIKIKDPPEKTDRSKYPYQIDEKILYDIIVNVYERFDPYFQELAREGTINRDVDVISAIYGIRKGHRPKYIKDASALFISTNNALAYAANKFNQKELSYFTIPSCLTDLFLGTILWLQSPAKVQEINKRKIIADAYAAIQPTEVLIKQYLGQVEKLKNDKLVNEEQYYSMRTHRAAINLLQEKTLGDPEAFDEKTIFEINEELTNRIKKEEMEKLKFETEAHEITKRELLITKNHSSNIEYRVKNIAKKTSTTISWFLFLIACFILMISLTSQFFSNFFKEHPSLNFLSMFFNIGSTIVSTIAGVTFLSLRKTISNKLENQIINFFIKI